MKPKKEVIIKQKRLKSHTHAKQICDAWDKALANNDIEGLLSLYTSDAILESPVIPYLLKSDTGILRGISELRTLFEKIVERKPSIRKHYKQNFFTDGETLIFEYPRQTPQGEQMDFVEIMKLSDGLIQYHKVYWGWRGVKVLKENLYYK
ncbi:nuclear transport factor 2 family protein [Legionella sp. CNM-1927-20]|uniref:nuclear transport factor 2 family protein n=1 Tax=Legionella sp. CNM-1927-20 TaxID=3422221 RepID=UPI00403AB45D